MEEGYSFRRSFRVGIDLGNMDRETIEQILDLANLNCFVENIQDMTEETFDTFDAIVFLNPILEKDDMNQLFKSVYNGTSLLIMISLQETPSITKSQIFEYLRVNIDKSKKMKRIKITYTPEYIVPMKRGTSDMMYDPDKKPQVFFDCPKPVDKEMKFIPLLKHKGQNLILQVNYGRGIVILTNSFCLKQIWAELLSHIVKYSNNLKKEIAASMISEIENSLPNHITNMFKIYEEIPIEALQKKLKIDMYTFNDFEKFIPIIEKLITSKKIQASIRGDILVKKSEFEQEARYFA